MRCRENTPHFILTYRSSGLDIFQPICCDICLPACPGPLNQHRTVSGRSLLLSCYMPACAAQHLILQKGQKDNVDGEYESRRAVVAPPDHNNYMVTGHDSGHQRSLTKSQSWYGGLVKVIGNIIRKIMWLEATEGNPLFLCAVKKINMAKYCFQAVMKGQFIPMYCLYVSEWKKANVWEVKEYFRIRKNSLFSELQT